MRPIGLVLILALVLTVGATTGCQNKVVRSQSPEEFTPLEEDVRVVGDLALPFGMHPIRVEQVALVTGLKGTGEDPPPSPFRAALLQEMQTRGVENPNRVLADPSTALVLVRGYLRPGIQKGDRMDVEIRVPTQSETSSLEGGWLMETRLSEQLIADRIRQGSVMALAEGPVLTDSISTTEDDKIRQCRGRVLGGGVALKSRSLGLVLKTDHTSVRNSQLIGEALNRRFHFFRDGIKKGVANPKTDEYIELDVHPRYKDNVERYMQVVRSVAIQESTRERADRLTRLERQLLEPVTSATAALRLEALGNDSIPVLKKGIACSDPEVRFYSAEALAYLDDTAAAAPLALAARNEPAFRVFALTALSAMDDYAAEEALRSLLDAPSAETRYGAFRALWAMNAKNPLVRGEELKEQFSYHIVAVDGPPLIHLTRNRRPEIVLFGSGQRFETPMILDAGKNILVDGRGIDTVTVSRFAANEPDQKRVVPNDVDQVIRAIVELGGTYPDVVDALMEAKTSHALASRLEVDALPEAGRAYERGQEEELAAGESANGQFVVDNPTPGLFSEVDARRSESEADLKDPEPPSTEERNRQEVGFLAKILRRGKSS
jgi:hypothetical protein